jgi:hypothetical protein
VADRNRLRLNREPGHCPVAPLGEHVVEQHRVHAADHEVAVGMDVIFVRHHVQTVLAHPAQQDLVRDGAGERAHGLAPQIGERRETGRVGVADAQHLAKLVVGQRHRHRRSACGGILDAAEADLRIPPGDALIDGGERDVQELGRPADAGGEQRRDLDVEADDPIGMGRIGLDKRRAAFGVTRPAQHARLRGDRRRTDPGRVRLWPKNLVVSGWRTGGDQPAGGADRRPPRRS